MNFQKKLLVIPAALLLAGASGIGFVHAAQGTTNAPAITAPAQTDNNLGSVQQGDQNTPDVAGATEANAPEAASAADAPGGPDVQQGDQTSADTGTAAEANSPEAASGVDAPGGPDVQQGDQTGPDTGN